jgi:6-pyruvoyltetrahydropterin/6-carboxytetrahydropterin synthase
MPVVSLTRRYGFPAAHRLHSPQLTDAQNRETYGKCNNPHGHGHDYEVELTVRGEVDPVTGRVVSLEVLDRLTEREILSPFRYQDLNQAMSEIPTTENLAREVDLRLRAGWPKSFPDNKPRLEKVSIRETARNICDVVNGND